MADTEPMEVDHENEEQTQMEIDEIPIEKLNLREMVDEVNAFIQRVEEAPDEYAQRIMLLNFLIRPAPPIATP